MGFLNSDDKVQMKFEYSPEWLNRNDTFPISQSLPLTGDFSQGKDDHRFFANLLPEATAREAICRGLGISIDNDFELLKAIGGECAGALQIIPNGVTNNESRGYQKIETEDLHNAVRSRQTFIRLNTGGKLRLSLAGAQDKWPVYREDSVLYWPIENSPSSHILKFINRDFKGLNWNEAYSSFLTYRLQLPSVAVSIHDGYSLSRRYDRPRSASGEIYRLHQEDFCQALGYSSKTKYEKEGGADFKKCVNLLRDISISPAEDVLHLLRWQILNLLIGNSDGHGKNISILYTREGPRLAPFYDIVCTRIYEGISPDLAFSIGGKADPGHIYKKDWQRFAEALEISPRLVFRLLNEYIRRIENELDNIYTEFSRKNGENPITHRINQLIRHQIRRTKTLIQD